MRKTVLRAGIISFFAIVSLSCAPAQAQDASAEHCEGASSFADVLNHYSLSTDAKSELESAISGTTGGRSFSDLGPSKRLKACEGIDRFISTTRTHYQDGTNDPLSGDDINKALTDPATNPGGPKCPWPFCKR